MPTLLQHVVTVQICLAVVFYVFYLQHRRARGVDNPSVSMQKFSMLFFPIATALLLGYLAYYWLQLIGNNSQISISQVIFTLYPMMLMLSCALSSVLLIFAAPLHTAFGKLWVKALEFPYLALASIGLLRVVNSSAIPIDRVALIDTLGIFIIAVAIAR